MKNRFPFTLSTENAKRIIDIACLLWRTKLAQQWGERLLLEDHILIFEDEYTAMREACTPDQHQLFDEIFGRDVEVGDVVVVTDPHPNLITFSEFGYTGTLVKIDNKYSYIPFAVEIGDEQIWCKGVRPATQEEIDNYCPYKDGELIFVKLTDGDWYLKYSTGKMIKGKVQVYNNQKTSGYTTTWTHHAPAKGITLPK